MILILVATSCVISWFGTFNKDQNPKQPLQMVAMYTTLATLLMLAQELLKIWQGTLK